MSQPRKTFTARSPVDLVAVAPFLLGFHPEDSVVLMTFGAGDVFHARVDLPHDEDDQAAVAGMLTDVVVRHDVGRVALLLYTDDPWCAATFHDAAVTELVCAGVEVIDVLRVGADRFHAAADPDDPGTPYDLRAHPFTAEQVVEGTVVHRTREELASSLEPVDPDDAVAVARAADAVDDQLFASTRFVTPSGVSRDLAGHARWVQRTLREHLASGAPLTAEHAGRLLLMVSVVEIRDVAWAEMTRAEAARHVDLWTDLVRRCPRDLLPAAACLLAFAAWLRGHGALAWCALDRCTAVDPAYSMAARIRDLLEGAVPPTAWTGIPQEDLPVFWAEDPAAS